MSSSIQRFRAKWVVPVSGQVIEDGEVIIEGDRIQEVRTAAPRSDRDVRDLGESILIPGLINIHTHLDYTLFRGILEDLEFFPWIRELTALRNLISESQWEASAALGAAEAVAGGITTIGDCTPTGASCIGAKRLGLGGIIYQEVFGIEDFPDVEDIIAEMHRRIQWLKKETADTHLKPGLSPHSPYTVRPDLMRAVADYARMHRLPICIHAAESLAEASLIRTGTGEIAERLKLRGIHWNPPGSSITAYLDSLGALGKQTLLVHGVQVSAGDSGLMRERGAAWAHCPKSNAKLGNGIAPLEMLGVQECENEFGLFAAALGLGTDSVASNNTMDMFEEMRTALMMQRGARRRIRALTAIQALHLATLGGARALGLEAEIGSIAPGKRADLCAVRLNALHSMPSYDPFSALVYTSSASDVCLTIAGGSTLYDSSLHPDESRCFPGFDMEPILIQIREANSLLRNHYKTDR